MSDLEAFELLAAYTPAPKSRRRSQELLRAAQIVFGISDSQLDTESPIDLRESIRRLRASDPLRTLAAVATFAEVLSEQEKDAVAFSAILSVADIAPTIRPSIGMVGNHLAGLADSVGRSGHALWDVCRCLVAYTPYIPPPSFSRELEPFIGKHYIESFDRLASSLDPALLIRLVSCWWFGRGQDQLANSTANDLLNSYYKHARSGNGWWSQSHVIGRTAVLSMMAFSCTSNDSLCELVESLAILPHEAPDGHCQYFAAAYLWNLLRRVSSEKHHDELKWRSVMPPKCFQGLLSDKRCKATDLARPVSIVTAAWIISEFFLTDQKGSLHEIWSHIFTDPVAANSRDTLPVLYGVLPDLRSLWYIQKLTWSLHLETRGDGSESLTAVIDELFETSHLLEQPIDDICRVIDSSLDRNECGAVEHAVQLVIQRLQSAKFRGRRNHDPKEDALGAVRLAESLLHVSGLTNDELAAYLGQRSTPNDAENLFFLANANLIGGNFERAGLIFSVLLNQGERHPHKLALYSGILLALEQHGQLEIAKSHIQRLAKDVRWIQDPQQGSLDTRTIVAGSCIRLLLTENPKWVETAVNVLSSELKAHFRRKDSHLDRFYNLHYTARIRHLIPRSLTGLTSEMTTRHVDRRRFAILWDIEFAQRAMHDERQFWLPGEADPAVPVPSDDLKVALGKAAKALSYSSDGSQMGQLCCLSTVSVLLRRAEPESGAEERLTLGTIHEEQYSTRIRTQTGRVEPRCESEADIAGILPPSTLLLKLGFSIEGGLVWSAFRARGGRLDLVGSDRGKAIENAATNLQAVIQEFDACCSSIRFRGNVRAQDQLSEGIRSISDGLALPGSVGAAVKRYGNLRERITSGWDASSPARALLHSLSSQFGQPNDWRRKSPTQQEWDAFWSPQGAKRDFDAAAESMLQQVAEIIPLPDITPLLRKDDDVVFMLEDILFAIPLSFLRVSVDGRQVYFFELARTVRTVLSPTVHGTFMADEWRPLAKNDRDQVLCISGVSDTVHDELVATRLLFESHANAATSSSLIWRGAWDRPHGCHDVMARGIYDTRDRGARTALLTILGHGHSDGGIQMRTLDNSQSTEYWTAQSVRQPAEGSVDRQTATRRSACELSSVDFLIQVSCSVGRAKQDGLYDVEGFPANLVVAGARSTVAARWPILADQAVTLANDLAKDYLRRRFEAIESATPFQQACMRGQALAKVRGEWAKDFRQKKAAGLPPSVGLHTAAAFELYGFA